MATPPPRTVSPSPTPFQTLSRYLWLYFPVSVILLPLLTTILLISLAPLLLYLSLLLDSLQLASPTLIDWFAKLGLSPSPEHLLQMAKGLSGSFLVLSIPQQMGTLITGQRWLYAKLGWREEPARQEIVLRWMGAMMLLGDYNWWTRNDFGAVPTFNAQLAGLCILLIAVLLPKLAIGSFESQAEAEKERAEAAAEMARARENAVEE